MKSFRSSIFAGQILVGCLLAVRLAIAHHSGAGFNSDEVKEFTATIKEFQFTNPHTWIQVIVTNEQGQQQEWSIEWGSPNSLARRGVRPSTFPPGAEVRMQIHPMANGSPAGGFVAARFSDGTTVGDWQD
jgi:Family of unknown function (DUF6152)